VPSYDRSTRILAPVDTSGHWFMMQVGMIVGFFTAWPVNRWLVRSGIKEKMDRRRHLAMMIEQIEKDRGRDGADAPLRREGDVAENAIAGRRSAQRCERTDVKR
jgi:hypothetical protein